MKRFKQQFRKPKKFIKKHTTKKKLTTLAIKTAKASIKLAALGASAYAAHKLATNYNRRPRLNHEIQLII